jgi:PAS domain S-box-containing protein
MFNINVETLLWIVVVCGLTLGGAIGYIARGPGSRHLRLWAGAMLLHGVAYVLLGLRGNIPDFVSIVIANVVLIAAYALIILAIARFKHVPVPGWVLGLPIVAVAVVFALYIDNQQVRSISISLILFLQQIPAIYLVLRRNGEQGPGHLLLAGALSVMAIIFLTRVVAFMLGIVPTPALATQGTVQVVTYICGIVALLLASIGFLVMVKERAEHLLRASEQHFRAFFKRSMVGMATIRSDKHWIEVNPALCGMLGYSMDELRQRTWSEITHSDDLTASSRNFDRVLAGEIDEYEQDVRYLRKSGEIVYAYVAVRCLRHPDRSVDYLVALIEDISQRKQREMELAENLEKMKVLNRRLEEADDQLLQSEKMASIGQLAAGVAHEINNPISFVSSNLNTLTRYVQSVFEILDAYEKSASDSNDLPALAKVRAMKAELDLDYIRRDTVELLAESKDGLDRVGKIVKDLREFSHMGETHWQWTDLHQCLESTLNIVWNELKYKCTVTRNYGKLPQVLCLPSQLNQVFMNLFINAVQAIETRGEIVITTQRLGEDAVQVSISDTGSGIPPEIINRIFDPFFTTKPVGKGTGLGLSLSWNIVKRHQGRIEVTSTPGKGTTFVITLPIEPVAQAEAGL